VGEAGRHQPCAAKGNTQDGSPELDHLKDHFLCDTSAVSVYSAAACCMIRQCTHTVPGHATTLVLQQDFTPGGNSGVTTPRYDMQPYSSIVLVSKPE
jgi:hypothetical protein